MQIHFDPQMNDTDFRPETMQIVAADDGLPMWVTTPADIVATLTIKSPCGYTVFTQKSTDSSGVITIRDDAFVDIYIDDSTMTSFQSGRHMLFMKMETEGYTTQVFTGVLPIYEVA